MAVAFAALLVAFGASASLRSLFTNQRHLIRLNVWRLEGLVFVLLMLDGQMPALWALPAGIGDIAVGATAFWVASRFATPSGRPLAIVFNLFGLADGRRNDARTKDERTNGVKPRALSRTQRSRARLRYVTIRRALWQRVLRPGSLRFTRPLAASR